jgi:hypothetical protein
MNRLSAFGAMNRELIPYGLRRQPESRWDKPCGHSAISNDRAIGFHASESKPRKEFLKLIRSI